MLLIIHILWNAFSSKLKKENSFTANVDDQHCLGNLERMSFWYTQQKWRPFQLIFCDSMNGNLNPLNINNFLNYKLLILFLMFIFGNHENSRNGSCAIMTWLGFSLINSTHAKSLWCLPFANTNSRFIFKNLCWM